MTDQNDFKSLDELFKSTFERLPESPAPSGWDQPSARVWENVQTEIQSTGGHQRRWQYGAALAGALVIGLVAFLLISRFDGTTESAADKSGERSVDQTETPLPALPEASLEDPAVPASDPAPPQVDQKTGTIYNSSVSTVENDGPLSLQLQVAEALPGSQSAPPNNTERRRLDGLDHETIWTLPLSPLPHRPLPLKLETTRQFNTFEKDH